MAAAADVVVAARERRAALCDLQLRPDAQAGDGFHPDVGWDIIFWDVHELSGGGGNGYALGGAGGRCYKSRRNTFTAVAMASAYCH